jgi:hypothetical protein
LDTSKIDKALLDPRKSAKSGDDEVVFRSVAELAAMRDLTIAIGGGGFQGHGPINLTLSRRGLGGC